MSRVVKGLEEQIDSFERRKLHDLKSILLDFVTVELSFHTKALELLTKAYQDVAAVDEIKDIEVRGPGFRSSLARKLEYYEIYTNRLFVL